MNATEIIKDKNELIKIIDSARHCYIGMIDENNLPYVLAFNFGNKDEEIYIHFGKTGKKVNILKNNHNVSVFIDTDLDYFYRDKEIACSWRMRYKSIIIKGKAEFIEDYELKEEGLKVFMSKYSGQDFKYSKPSVNNINVVKIIPYEVTGRKFEYHRPFDEKKQTRF